MYEYSCGNGTLCDGWFVQIFYSEMRYTKVETKVAYSGLALLCDIGGSLGLILGATMLTMCELIDFLLQLAGDRIKVRPASTTIA